MKSKRKFVKLIKADEFLRLAEELKKANAEYLKKIDEIIKKRDEAIKVKLKEFDKMNQAKLKYGK
jgi:D-ribose pyranose/furanose isomerase RbsD